MPEDLSVEYKFYLISVLRAIPDPRMRRGLRIPAWSLLLVAVLGILSHCQSLRDLEPFAERHHGVLVLTEALGIELRRYPSDSAFRYFFHQVDVAALCPAIRDWTIAQIPAGATDLDQLVCDGKTLRGSIEPTPAGQGPLEVFPSHPCLLRHRRCCAQEQLFTALVSPLQNPSAATDLISFFKALPDCRSAEGSATRSGGCSWWPSLPFSAPRAR